MKYFFEILKQVDDDGILMKTDVPFVGRARRIIGVSDVVLMVCLLFGKNYFIWMLCLICK